MTTDGAKGAGEAQPVAEVTGYEGPGHDGWKVPTIAWLVENPASIPAVGTKLYIYAQTGGTVQQAMTHFDAGWNRAMDAADGAIEVVPATDEQLRDGIAAYLCGAGLDLKLASDMAPDLMRYIRTGAWGSTPGVDACEAKSTKGGA